MMLTIEPLTREAFAPFGQVIEADPQAQTSYAINAGTSERFHKLAELDPGPDGKLVVSIFRAQPREMPFTITMLERHPLASQAFMPLQSTPFFVVVAPKGDGISTTNVRAFLAKGHQGVNFAAGVWHHPLLALGQVCDFLVIDRDEPPTGSHNCDEILLTSPITLSTTITSHVKRFA